MNFSALIFLLLFQACAVFQTQKLKSLDSAAKSICLNSEGKGKIQITSDMAYFGFYSVLEMKQANWLLGMDFPLQDEETFELDWSEEGNLKFKTSIEQKILRQNKQVNPKELDSFINFAASALKDIVSLKTNKTEKLNLKWRVSDGVLIGESSRKNAKITFDAYNEQYYQLMQIELITKENKRYKLEFNTRKCHEKL